MDVRKTKLGGQVLYPELSYQLMGISFEIHTALGPGFTEPIYEAAFVQELGRYAIPYEQQKPIQVVYKEQLLGIYRLDLLVDTKIVVELKAVSALTDIFIQQLFSYLKAGDYRLGLILNFGAKHLEHVRIIH